MKKTLLVAALMASASIAMACQPGPADDHQRPLFAPLGIDGAPPAQLDHDQGPKTALQDGVVVTGATSTASFNNPQPVVIRLADGHELLASAVYGPDNRYSVRSERLLGPGGYPVNGFVVDSKHMEGVAANKDKRLAPGTHVTFVDVGT